MDTPHRAIDLSSHHPKSNHQIEVTGFDGQSTGCLEGKRPNALKNHMDWLSRVGRFLGSFLEGVFSEVKLQVPHLNRLVESLRRGIVPLK